MRLVAEIEHYFVTTIRYR